MRFSQRFTEVLNRFSLGNSVKTSLNLCVLIKKYHKNDRPPRPRKLVRAF